MRMRLDSVLLTDLYQLTMMQAYLEHGYTDTAVFEFFVRRLPEGRNFLMAAGLAQAVDYLRGLRFTPEELEWLRGAGRFSTAFIDYLETLRYTGDLHAMAEGTVFFANEPILRVTAPLPVAQLVESRLINLLQLQTMIASKAARVTLAAPEGSMLVDFGMRRAHGAEAALYAARAAYLAGFAGTATVLAGCEFGIPVFGTMAHSFIQAHAEEVEAFEHFAHSHPGDVVLLIDTYDTEAAAHKVVELAPRLAARGIRIKAVRIDSGDLAEHARKVRRILDAGGLAETGIFASGNLDEYALQGFRQSSAPINGFGVGTHLDVSADAPFLDCAYKLQEYAGSPRRKRSEGKATWAGRKQVYRQFDRQGRIARDVLTVEDDPCEGLALLQPVLRAGEPVAALPGLEAARRHALQELERLPPLLRALEPAAAPFRPEVSPALEAVTAEADRAVEQAMKARPSAPGARTARP